MTHVRTIISILVSITCVITAVEAEAQIDSSVNGTYRFVGGSAERARHEEALEEHLALYNMLARPIARRIFRRAAPLHDSVTVRVENGYMTVGMGDWTPRTTTLDGAPTNYVNRRNDEVRLTRRIRGGQVVESSCANGSSRTLRYRFSGERLTWTWTFQHPRMPSPLSYRLVYAR